MGSFAGVAFLLQFFLGAAQQKPPRAVPESLRVPAEQELLLHAQATGFQIYVCQAGQDQKAGWGLKAPEATLLDSRGKEIGKHYAGPTWKHKDGSEVTGKVAARQDSPDPNSIPWLLLNANGHTGDGIFSRVTAIQRLHTKGGQPPAAAGCDESKLGTEVKTPYSADYCFYAPAAHTP